MSFGDFVGDILSIGQLCWTVYRACRNAAGHYEEATTELKSLHINLKTLAEDVENPKSLLSRRGAAMRDEFSHILRSVEKLLKDLEQMVAKYRSLATLEKRTWDRLRFGLKDFNIIRQKLTYHTAQMDLFLSSLTAGALGRIENLLEEFISEVRSGRRPPTILSIEQDGEEGALGWEQLESDLSESGVSIKDIDRHREEIVEYLALLKINSTTQSQDDITLPEFTSNGGPLSGQVQESNWDSISERIASNTNDEEEKFLNQLYSPFIPNTSDQNNSPGQILTVPLKGITENDSEVLKTKEVTSRSSIDSQTMGGGPLDKPKDIVTPVVTAAQLFKKNGFDVDCDPSKLPDALKWAAKTGNIDCMQYLLARKPEISVQNGFGDLMEYVVGSGNEKLLGLMMEYQVDMNIADKRGWTALFWATFYNNEKMVETLLSPSSEVKINTKDIIRGNTPLHEAAGICNGKITKMLIHSGADVHALNDEGETAIHEAARAGVKDNTRILLDSGANIEATNEEGLTALRIAFDYGNDDVVRLLLQRGANTRSAHVGPFMPTFKCPEESRDRFEAARQAILWFEEENRRKAQEEMDQLSSNSIYEPPRKVPKRVVENYWDSPDY